tara:strand:+ start:359 stop:778 length:420 start_codon:yes stop_codon:yes gene_type:complete
MSSNSRSNSNFNSHFIIGSFYIINMPKELVQDCEDLLSDMDDGYEISFFIKKFSDHNIKFELVNDFHDFGSKYYRASVDWEDYLKWSDEMKDFWDHEKDNQYFKEYLVKTQENGFTCIGCRYDYDSTEMKSLLIDPDNI